MGIHNAGLESNRIYTLMSSRADTRNNYEIQDRQKFEEVGGRNGRTR